jgi:menaquinone-dependent protoporphyrinogen oxidase
MKVLLAYTSKTGTTKECMERLKKELHGVDAEMIEIDKQTPELDAYDVLVIGAPVRFGKFPKAVKTFLKDNEEKICQKPHALFLCCGLAHEHEYYLERLFSYKLRETAFLVTDFGGTLNYKGQNFFEKLLIHAIRSSIRESEIEDGEYTPEMPGILPENIGKMATYIRTELGKLANS